MSTEHRTVVLAAAVVVALEAGVATTINKVVAAGIKEGKEEEATVAVVAAMVGQFRE